MKKFIYICMLSFMLLPSISLKAETIYFYDNGLKFSIYRNLIGEYDSKVFLIKSDDYNDLTEVTIPEVVTFAGSARQVLFGDTNLFENCQKLERVHWLRENGIPMQCFKNCENLTFFDVKNELYLRYISEESFAGCTSLKEFTIPKGVSDLDLHAFKGVKLEKLHWNAEWCAGTMYGDVTTEGANSNTTGDTNSDDELPFTIHAFLGGICMALDSCMDVSSVQEVTIGNSVQQLPFGFMHRAQITEVTIPASVKFMYGGSFADCRKLRKIICNVSDPAYIRLGKHEFRGVDKELCTLYVPKGSAELYRNADQWKDFQKIVEEGEEEHDPYDLNGDGLVDVTDVNLLIDRILGK